MTDHVSGKYLTEPALWPLNDDGMIPEPPETLATYSVDRTDDGFDKLCEHLRTHGQQKPCEVQYIDDKPFLVAGRQRWRACQRLEQQPWFVQVEYPDPELAAHLDNHTKRLPTTDRKRFAEQLAEAGYEHQKIAAMLNSTAETISRDLMVWKARRKTMIYEDLTVKPDGTVEADGSQPLGRRSLGVFNTRSGIAQRVDMPEQTVGDIIKQIKDGKIGPDGLPPDTKAANDLRLSMMPGKLPRKSGVELNELPQYIAKASSDAGGIMLALNIKSDAVQPGFVHAMRKLDHPIKDWLDLRDKTYCLGKWEAGKPNPANTSKASSGGKKPSRDRPPEDGAKPLPKDHPQRSEQPTVEVGNALDEGGSQPEAEQVRERLLAAVDDQPDPSPKPKKAPEKVISLIRDLEALPEFDPDQKASEFTSEGDEPGFTLDGIRNIAENAKRVMDFCEHYVSTIEVGNALDEPRRSLNENIQREVEATLGKKTVKEKRKTFDKDLTDIYGLPSNLPEEMFDWLKAVRTVEQLCLPTSPTHPGEKPWPRYVAEMLTPDQRQNVNTMKLKAAEQQARALLDFIEALEEE